METATCRVCRSVNHASSIRCLNCGAPLQLPDVPEGVDLADLPAPPSPSSPVGWSSAVATSPRGAGQKRPLSAAAILGTMLVVVLVVAIGVFVFTGDRVTPGLSGLGSFFGLLLIGAFVFWLWMLIDVVMSSADAGTKVLWVLLIVFLGVIGALAYAVMGRSSRTSRY